MSHLSYNLSLNDPSLVLGMCNYPLKPILKLMDCFKMVKPIHGNVFRNFKNWINGLFSETSSAFNRTRPV